MGFVRGNLFHPRGKFPRQLAIKSHVAKNVSSYGIYRKRSCTFELLFYIDYILINVRHDGCPMTSSSRIFTVLSFSSLSSPSFDVHFSPFARRPTSDCFIKRLGNAIFTRSQCVSPVIDARAVTRRHSARNSCHSSKAILLRRWLGVASGPHFPSGGFAASAKFHTLSP